MRILLTNDDGIYAAGIAAINKTLKEIGEVVVVAPEAERSGASHSITWAHPLRLRKTYIENKFFGYAVSGSPADCVKMAAMEIMKEPPELVVSGINLGANTGIHVLYSGTVAASIEGSILGIPSVAVSIDVSRYVDLGYAAIIARDVIKQIIKNKLPKCTLINVNIPSVPREEIKGIRLTRQYTHGFEESVDRRKDPGGNTYYWLVGGSEITVEEEGTDVQSIRDGYISITPLCYDLTDYNLLKSLDTWDWKGVEEDVCKFKGVTK
ncbi:MAG: 5'/3'-nucleotidase SurE [Planctomycetes bacterium RIFCSPHIGHO2_02_FULL_50_42]|nr:MAG: 5'/3'-nucleotidase SurE [Planctomycetes bacterium GWA2_50_13]OHB87324.1 MAG: 5'/3'-nucleotidase SurE [Planctomycetes bacterium RIFCSPHIGHO2_02_FULL_50_42]OHB96579.1 MAG: 5'/3'-nucleotidase SurE [Planctomycetes bacterium RIFCSPLOWO2_02_FULL_50_16]OHC05010.1 MAG: 5'/3'-nucleotidase SurE [Planctomycetes bacterium RIFCSPLOWO2_12_FULL_50_35]